ncbi:hypothetical protein [Streptomyces sp. NPDC055085]
MKRSIKCAAILLAAAALSGLPGTAMADGDMNFGDITVAGINQVAGDDIFNAGHNNTVGSNDGQAIPGLPGVGADQLHVVLKTGASPAGAQLQTHDGDANFPGQIPSSYTVLVDYSAKSTAVYRINNDMYYLTLTPGSQPYCTTDSRSARCSVTPGYSGMPPTIEMG